MLSSLPKTRVNWEKRRIDIENQKLVDRITETKPAYPTKTFLNEYDKSQRYMVNSSYSLRKVCEKKLREFNHIKESLKTDKTQFVRAPTTTDEQ